MLSLGKYAVDNNIMPNMNDLEKWKDNIIWISLFINIFLNLIILQTI